MKWRHFEGADHPPNVYAVRSLHQIQSDDQLGEPLRQVKEVGLVPEEQVRLCAVGDGAQWIWNQVKELFPLVLRILNYYLVTQVCIPSFTIWSADDIVNHN